MKTIVRRGLSGVLALTLLTSPLLAMTAEAGGHGRSRGRRSRGCRQETRVVYVEKSRHRHHHDGDSDIVPFLGGVVLGAILGNASASSRCVERRYVYDCDACGRHYGSYDGWTSHLVTVHDVPSCDVREEYPEYQGGYWENY